MSNMHNSNRQLYMFTRNFKVRHKWLLIEIFYFHSIFPLTFFKNLSFVLLLNSQTKPSIILMVRQTYICYKHAYHLV